LRALARPYIGFYTVTTIDWSSSSGRVPCMTQALRSNMREASNLYATGSVIG
jgi:hypothetical protein